MAATTTLHRPPVKPKPAVTYPVLAQSYATRQVILFTSIHRGVVLVPAKSGSFSVGEHVTTLVDVTDKTVWEILPEGTTVEIVQGAFE